MGHPPFDSAQDEPFDCGSLEFIERLSAGTGEPRRLRKVVCWQHMLSVVRLLVFRCTKHPAHGAEHRLAGVCHPQATCPQCRKKLHICNVLLVFPQKAHRFLCIEPQTLVQ